MTTTTGPPRVTIGLVVRNGADHLEEAISSLLDQTWRSFELIVYDNASTDRTPAIAAAFAERDPRVRVVRHDRNLGAIANYAAALDAATAPCFAWAASDDRRHPEFLVRLLARLDEAPDAALACCAVRDLDPDGTPGALRPETTGLEACAAPDAPRRLRAYLREAPGTPFYGVYRTEAARAALPILRALSAPPDPIPIGVDVIVLAAVLGRGPLLYEDAPLLEFRRGGLSHRVDAYGGAIGYVRALARFARGLHAVSLTPVHGPVARMRTRLAVTRSLARLLASRPMRRLTWEHLRGAIPGSEAVHAWWLVHRHRAFRDLRRRAAALPRGSRVAIFGAGKHTARCLAVIEKALAPAATVVGILDDAPRGRRLGGYRVTDSASLSSLRPDVILVSSDVYEAALARRASEVTGASTPVWCVYDRALETRHPSAPPHPQTASAVSADSTEARNAAISASAVSVET